MVGEKGDKNIGLNPCMNGYEQPGCLEYLVEQTIKVAKPTKNIVVSEPIHMQPLFTEESWSSFWIRKFGAGTFPFTKLVFNVLDRSDNFPGDGFLDISNLPKDDSDALFDNIRPSNDEEETILNQIRKLVRVYRQKYLDIYYVKKIKNQLIGIKENGDVSVFYNDALTEIWNQIEGQYPEVETVRFVVDQQTFNGTHNDSLNGNRVGYLAVQLYTASPRVTGGLGVFKARGDIERLPYSNKMAGFGPGIVDETIMVLSAALVILAMFSGKRGSAHNARPVVEFGGRSPITHRPIDLVPPEHMIEEVNQVLGGSRKIMPNIYFAKGVPREKPHTSRTQEKDVISNTSSSNIGGVVEDTNSVRTTSSNQKKLEQLLIAELINPDFIRDVERKGSIIRDQYRGILDPFHDSPYPLNCVGTYARVLPDYLESFVNIGHLADMIATHTRSGPLRQKIARSDSNKLRIALRSAIHAIGDISYAYEWNDTATYSSINTLLESMAAYRTKNKHIAEQLGGKLPEYYRDRDEVTILDVGSGVGGTSLEVVRYLEQLKMDGKIPPDYKSRTQLILLDVSNAQLSEAQQEIIRKFGLTNIDLVESNFRDLPKILSSYRGKIDVIVSGAAICHVTEKSSFFDSLFSIMRPGGIMSFWDPAISQYQGDYIRKGDSGRIRIIYEAEDGSRFVILKGEILDVSTLSRLKNQRYTTTVEIPSEEIPIFAYGQQLHLLQMGYSEANIGKENSEALARRLYEDVLRETQTENGFNLLEWYRNNLVSLPDESIPRQTKWTPYDLIEAVETRQDYENYIRNGGFKLVASGRFSDLKTESTSFANNVVVFYLIEK